MELRIENLSYYYKKKCALKNINLILTPGIYGLVGPNGAGKTTLMNILSGLLSFSIGKIHYSESEFLSDEYYRHFGYLPQYNSLYDCLTCYEFLDYISVLKEVKNKNSILDVLSMVNLIEKKDQRIKGLSGGMKQRLSIAQVLLNDPNIILFDEPTAGLDPRERIRLKNILGQLAKDKIIIVSTHIISDMENLADKIILLDEGEIIAFDKPDNLKAKIKKFFYETEIDQDRFITFEKYQKTHIQITQKGYKIKFISQKRLPFKQVQHINLEDVFLYYYGENYD